MYFLYFSKIFENKQVFYNYNSKKMKLSIYIYIYIYIVANNKINMNGGKKNYREKNSKEINTPFLVDHFRSKKNNIKYNKILFFP